MDYEKLKEELKNDPSSFGYSTMLQNGSHNLIEEVLNTKQFEEFGFVGIDVALIWMAKYKILPKLRMAQQSGVDSVSAIAEIAILLVQNPNISRIDFGIPEVQAMFQALVDAGVIAEVERDELLSKSVTLKSRCEILHIPYVSAHDISMVAQEVLNG